MVNRKRTIKDGYEVVHCVSLGGSEIMIAANNNNTNAPYIVSDCVWNNDLCFESHHNVIGSTDYLEIMKLFAARISERVASIENERELHGIPHQTLTAADCHPVGRADIEGSVVVLKSEKLPPEYRSIDYQLLLCTGGAGAKLETGGRMITGQNLITGKINKYKRTDIAGIISHERLPDWARVNAEALQKPTERESVLDKIRQGQHQSSEQQQPHNKKRDKGGQEL